MKNWHWWALALLLIGGGGKVAYDKTRGLRNKNPGNIRHSNDRWQGAASSQTDPDYVQFSEYRWGVRAMARVLHNYQSRHGLRTVRGIIGRWAPPNEHHTESYIASVAGRLDVGPDEYISLAETGAMVAMVSAIIRHENGIQPFSADDLAEWVALA